MFSDWNTLRANMPWFVTLLYAIPLLVGTVLICPDTFGPTNRLHNHYDIYAKAIGQGQLWVKQAASHTECPFDTSFYNGKCFLYWGIVPAVLHLIPGVSDRVVTFIGSTVLLFFLLKLLLRLAESIAPSRKANLLVLLPIMLFLAFSTGIATSAFFGTHYSEAMILSHALGTAGLYVLFFVVTQSANPLPLAGLAGALLALASITRPTWFSVNALFAVFFLWRCARGKTSVPIVLAVVMPISLAFALHGWLNYVRFESPFEFGLKYTTVILDGPKDIRREGVYLWKVIPQNFLTYFFTGSPPYYTRLADGRTARRLFVLTRLSQYGITTNFPNGLFVVMPSLLLGIPLWLRLRLEQKKKLAMGLLFLPMGFVILINATQIWRYQIEIWYMALIFLIPPLWAYSRKAPPWQVGFHWLSVFFGGIITLVSTYYTLMLI